jgi:hypothetical protein
LFAAVDPQDQECLARLDLAKPRSFADRVTGILLRAALKASAADHVFETSEGTQT